MNATVLCVVSPIPCFFASSHRQQWLHSCLRRGIQDETDTGSSEDASPGERRWDPGSSAVFFFCEKKGLGIGEKKVLSSGPKKINGW